MICGIDIARDGDNIVYVASKRIILGALLSPERTELMPPRMKARAYIFHCRQPASKPEPYV